MSRLPMCLGPSGQRVCRIVSDVSSLPSRTPLEKSHGKVFSNHHPYGSCAFGAPRRNERFVTSLLLSCAFLESSLEGVPCCPW